MTQLDVNAAMLNTLQQILQALVSKDQTGIPYMAEIDVVNLGASTVNYTGGTINLGLQQDFVITHLSSKSTGVYSFQWREAGTGFWNSKNAIRSDTLFLGYEPVKLSTPYRIPAGSTQIESLINELSGLTNSIYLLFIGELRQPGT